MKKLRKVALFALASTTFAPQAHAGGFYLQEQSQRDIGRALSGGAAAADDPSTIFFNPAGMTELEGIQINSGATALFITSAQKNTGTTRTGPSVVPTLPTGGNNGGNPFDGVVPVPTFYASAHVGDSPLWLGLGVSAPFGLKLRYDDNFFARYDSIYSSLFTLNVAPSAAVRVNDSLSIGGGVDVQYMKVTLTSALPNVTPGSADGLLRAKGDDVSVGWNFGVLAKTGPAQFGLHYRSGIKQNLRGTYTVTGLTAPLSAANYSTGLSSSVALPDILTGSVKFAANDRITLFGTAKWYNWSKFRNITLIPDVGSRAIKDLEYKDSWSIAGGADYQVKPGLTVRGGVMWDKTPTNPALLTTRVPDGNRTWLTTGMSYDVNPHLTLNGSYAHVFVRDSHLGRTDDFYTGTGADIAVDLSSTGTGNVDMIAASLTARF